MTFKIEEYEIIVSIGMRCIPSIAMADLKIKQDTYTFDWTQSNPQVVLDCIKDNFIKYNNFNFDKISNLYDLNLRYPKDFEKSFDNKFINEYGMCFTHYTHLNYDEFKNLCNRRSQKFMELLTSTKKILFVYVSTEKIELQIKQYNYLIEFEKYLLNNYPKLNFKVLSIGYILKNNTENIINYFYDIKNNKIGDYDVSKQNKLCNRNGDFRILNFFEIIFKNKSKCDNTGIFG